MPVDYVLGTNEQEMAAKQRFFIRVIFFSWEQQKFDGFGLKRLALEREASSFFRPGHRLESSPPLQTAGFNTPSLMVPRDCMTR
jgi:hypothetical protein